MKRLNILVILFAITIITVTLTGCNLTKDDNDKIEVITTLFPQYDFTKQIAGDKVDVELILPPGIEAHSFQPTSKQVVSIYQADLLVYTGDFMETWVDSIENSRDSESLYIVDASEGVSLTDHQGHDHEQEEHHDEDNHVEDTHSEEEHHDEDNHVEDTHSEEDNHDEELLNVDPHYWTDPLNAKIMVDNILEGLIEVDPENADFYRENASNYKVKLEELHQEISSVLSHTTHDTIIYAGHFAFGYFVDRYSLHHESPYSNFSPNTLPSISQYQKIMDTVSREGQTHIYFEENIDPSVANTIAEETDTDTLLLHALHNISKDDLNNDATYLTLMNKNIENLKIGLDYNEE